MSRLGSCGITVLASSLLLLFLGCGGGVSTTPDQVVVPGVLLLTPQPDVSLELGGTQSFTATAQDSNGAVLSPSPLITFVSSNPTVVQVAASGLACAGVWDSLTLPQICTPGPVGTAVVTAVSNGVSSSPVTVHVHQHIDSVTIAPVPTTTPTPDCVSKGFTLDYQVSAFNRGMDITPTVGPFSWSTLSASVATASTTATGLVSGRQARITAVNPGFTSLFASIAGVTSPTVSFITCPVKSISLALNNTTSTSFTVGSGSAAITPTVTDSSGTEITGVPLTWSSSDAAAFTASGSSSGAAAFVKPGSATIIASCLPPTCNIGFSPPKAIYPENVITGTGTGTGTTTTSAISVWVTSTECGVLDTTTQVVTNSDDCVDAIFPVDPVAGTTGVGTDLPITPNSIQFDRQSTKAYLGTDSGRLGAVGLSIVTPGTSLQVAPTVAALASAPGKVLAISPSGTTVIVSDTADTPNQVFIVSGSALAATLPIIGATAAEFAPDSSKAYILADNNLYIYSASAALKKLSFTNLGSSATFLADGAFGYVAGGSAANKLTVLKTCDNMAAKRDDGNSADVALNSTPVFLKASPDNQRIWAFNKSGVEFVDVTTTGRPDPGFPTTATADGCAPPAPAATPPLPGGLPTVINQHNPNLFSFGQGTFTPVQFIVSSNGTRAYILASDRSNIIVFNIDTQTTSTVQLSGSSIPIRASLSTDGTRLYVIGRDLMTKVNSIHVIDTTINTDINQVQVSQSLCHPKPNLTGNFTCNANLIAVKP